MFQPSSVSKPYRTLGLYNQATLKARFLKHLLFILFWEKRKRQRMELKERSPLPKCFLYLSRVLLSKIIPVHCHWQQELCVRENIQFSWVGLAQVSLRGEFMLFILSLGYRWTPAWSRVGVCYNVDIRGQGDLLCSLPFWCAREKWECSKNSLWLNGLKLRSWIILFTVWLVESWGFVIFWHMLPLVWTSWPLCS